MWLGKAAGTQFAQDKAAGKSGTKAGRASIEDSGEDKDVKEMRKRKGCLPYYLKQNFQQLGFARRSVWGYQRGGRRPSSSSV